MTGLEIWIIVVATSLIVYKLYYYNSFFFPPFFKVLFDYLIVLFHLIQNNMDVRHDKMIELEKSYPWWVKRADGAYEK